MKKYLTKEGFTLAEVLIVLGVIGIVAALTIPALMKNWQQERWDTANKVFKNRMFEAVSQMHARGRLTGHTNTGNFVEGLKNFMKVGEDCGTDLANCFVSDKVSEFNTGDGFGEARAFKLVNGANVIIAYDPNCNLDPASLGQEVADCSIAMLYDTNGNEGPNEMEKDIWGFNLGKTTVSSCPGSNCNGCPEGWGCCNGKCIGPEFSAANWQDAKNKCDAQGGGIHLPSGEWTNGNCFDIGLSTTLCPKNTEAMSVWNYCQSGNSCSDYYWLAEAHTSMAGRACSLYPKNTTGNGIICTCVAGDNYRHARCIK